MSVMTGRVDTDWAVCRSHNSLLSPLLYSLFTHDCVATHASNSIIKFADDTTVVGLITNNDETAYREEVCGVRKITSHSTSTKLRR